LHASRRRSGVERRYKKTTPSTGETHKASVTKHGVTHCPFSFFSALFRAGKSDREMDQHNTRKILKADSMIVATAKQHGATAFYSHDQRCLSLAKEARMDAFDLPLMPSNLYEY
jgi:predicted nucleic acid-binding protein